MDKALNKYFAGELTSDEKESFLMEVDRDEVLKGNFVDDQSLLAIIDWIFSGHKDDEKLYSKNWMNLCARWNSARNKIVVAYHE